MDRYGRKGGGRWPLNDMKRILLVDDSNVQLRIISAMLQGKYEMLMSTSGLEAIRMAREEQPDLILLDYDMPVLSGKETFQKLQQQEETRDIPVIFLTGIDEKDDVVQVLKLRPQGYLLKPVEQKLLIESIEKSLSEREERG